MATAGERVWLVPLSHLWDGERLLFVTDEDAPTVRNARTQPAVRVALGHARDVVLVDGHASVEPIAALAPGFLDAYQARHGNDPRSWAGAALWVRPLTIQAWREENELHARTIMRNGRWLA